MRSMTGRGLIPPLLFKEGWHAQHDGVVSRPHPHHPVACGATPPRERRAGVIPLRYFEEGGMRSMTGRSLIPPLLFKERG
jgi:hypothetical protein